METACFETKLGWITVKKNRGNVYSLSFGKTNKTIELINNETDNYISKKNKSLELNCGYGKGYSVLDIVKTFERVSKKRLKLKFLKRRDGDTIRAVCDTKLMNNLIKFKPKFNSITIIQICLILIN